MAGGLEPPCPRDAGKLLNWRTGCELQLHCLSPSLSTLQPKFCVVALLCSARIPQIMAQRSESVLAAPTEKLRMIEETRHDIRANHPIRRSEEHTSELQSRGHLVCRLLLEKK